MNYIKLKTKLKIIIQLTHKHIHYLYKIPLELYSVLNMINLEYKK